MEVFEVVMFVDMGKERIVKEFCIWWWRGCDEI